MLLNLETLSRRGRLVSCVAALTALAACGHHEVVDQSQEAAKYVSHARGVYVPPGPPSDPWGPYISEASDRFDVPQRWIREVMHQESGGNLYRNGRLITSWVGAMGLMQVMPETYDGLRIRYELGDDPFDPHENIMAGTAYMREMYDIYGSPGFLAAYNAGPKRLDDYLSNTRPLPLETRRYVASIGPGIMGVWPKVRSPAENYAMNMLPLDIPPGLRYGRAYASTSDVAEVYRPAPVHVATHATQYGRSTQYAHLPVPPRAVAPPVQTASIEHYGSGRHGYHVISQAMAEPIPAYHGGASGGQWAVQVGSFGNSATAHSVASSAKQTSGAEGAHQTVAGVQSGHATVYRARLTGLSREGAMEACQKLAHSKHPCVVLSPGSQS